MFCLSIVNNVSLFIVFYMDTLFIGAHSLRRPGLQSGRGHGLIPAHGDPGIGDPAPAPETAVTIPHALARWSAGRGRRRESGDRKAFQHPRPRH